ncbi:nucleotidyltransferase domain-containing protein [bacterium]|nr:nucleotidyltransferase domain-containing protein [bacterium]
MEPGIGSLIESITQVLADRAEFVYLYGSVAAGRVRKDSDIDLGVYLKKENPDFQDRLDLLDALNRSVKRDIDLVILNQCDPVIAMQVLSNGRLILNSNDALRIQYMMKQLSMYADLKFSRKIIEDNLLRGGVYAR